MYRVDMYYTVKTLHRRGYSKRKIAQTLGIHRNTVSRILEQVVQGEFEPAIKMSITVMLGQWKRSIMGQGFRESLGHFPGAIIQV